jgi:mycothiol synthase
MEFTARDFQGEDDIQAMLSLAKRHLEENLHVIDLPYRFSSWALDAPANTRLWFDEAGSLSAWAVMQSPFWMVDYAILPKYEECLFSQILAWAESSASETLSAPYARPAWYTTALPHQAQRILALQARGWENQKDTQEDPWTKAWMIHPLDKPRPRIWIPAGYNLRCFDPDCDADTYVSLHQAAFETKNMTLQWRRQVTRRKEYQADLNLVMSASDGRAAAFCIGWYDPDTRRGQVEPMGVHPDFQGKGLGRIILNEMLSRFQGMGARSACVETDNYRNAAFRLYEKSGFRVSREVNVFRMKCQQT